MTLRILAGHRKGALLATRPGPDTRPLLGRVRQSLFDLLTSRIEDAVVLDLFAGSGAVGLEAVSRGARWATFADAEPAALAVIRRNITKLRFEAQTRTVRANLPRDMRSIPLPPDLSRYNLVFLMPPFGLRLLPPTLDALLLQARELLAPGAWLVGQLERGEPLPEPPPPALTLFDHRLYGQNQLIFWTFAASE